MTSPSPLRLLDGEALAGIVDAAARAAPDGRVAILDLDDLVVAATDADGLDPDVGGGGGGAPGRPAAPAAERTIEVDGVPVGRVVADGPNAAGLADLVGRSLELALAESVVRRSLARAALDTYRELALLYRIGKTIGACLRAEDISPMVLGEVERVLRPGASLVRPLGQGAVVQPARRGDSDLLAELDGVAEQLIATVDSTGAPDLLEPGDGPFSSLIAAPLQSGSDQHGVVVLGRRRGERPFVPGDLKLLGAIAAHAAIAFERATLHRSDGQRQRLEHEMAIGRRIQLALMPRRFPEVAGWEFAAAYEAAREVGGDFYDAFGIRGRPDQVGLVVADVTGKGIPSALLMADAKALVHAAADTAPDPAESLSRVNRILVGERGVSLFITIFHAVLDAPTGRLQYASAGHEPTLLLRADGRVELLEAPGSLVGMSLDAGIDWREATLEPGDAIVGYTDGITEARDVAGSFYGEERLIDLVAASAGRSAADIAASIVEDVRTFRGEAEAYDDLTLLVVRRSAAPA